MGAAHLDYFSRTMLNHTLTQNYLAIEMKQVWRSSFFHYTQQILKEWRRPRLSMIQIQNKYMYNFEVTFLLFIYFEI